MTILPITTSPNQCAYISSVFLTSIEPLLSGFNRQSEF